MAIWVPVTSYFYRPFLGSLGVPTCALISVYVTAILVPRVSPDSGPVDKDKVDKIYNHRTANME